MEKLYFSTKPDKESVKLFLKMLLFAIPVLFICSLFFLTEGNIVESLIVTAYALLVSCIIFSVEIFLINLKQLKTRLFISDNEIVRECGRKERRIPWPDIRKLRIIENPKGEILGFKLGYGVQGKAMRLYGFEKMGKIVAMVKEKIPANALIETKREKLDVNNPITVAIFVCIPMPVCILIYKFVVRPCIGWICEYFLN